MMGRKPILILAIMNGCCPYILINGVILRADRCFGQYLIKNGAVTSWERRFSLFRTLPTRFKNGFSMLRRLKNQTSFLLKSAEQWVRILKFSRLPRRYDNLR